MDNPEGMYTVSEATAALDYKAIHNMLEETINFKYTQSHVMSDGILKIILAELEYWHNLAERLLKEKVNG